LVISLETQYYGGFKMKKIISFMVIAVLIAGTVCAQDKAPRENSRQRDIVSVEGNLKLENGIVSVQSGDTVYRIPLLNRYIGFINGLREGAKVSVEGNAFRNFIMPKKVVIDDKTYEFGGSEIARNNFVPGNQTPRRDLAPKNAAPGRNMVPPARNMAPQGRNMLPPGRNMWPGRNMGPMHFNPWQKAPRPRG
jgi:hypothetical protein